MARFIAPMDICKTFEVYFKNQDEAKEFNFWEYRPFLDYLKPFNNDYGYTVSVRKDSGLFSKSETRFYTVRVYEIAQ